MRDDRERSNNVNEGILGSYERVLETYASLGYSRELLGQWALPERDALALLAKVEEWQPHNVLEVGTYVGVTTLLIALHTGAETQIHTVDPNFPLQVEMSAMQSNLYESNVAIRTQQLGLQAARSLGLDQRIDFHEGGFSVASTFASNNTNPNATVKIVGESVCAKYGPFDFIFVDGLHYEDAVFSDLMLAACHLTPEGVIGIHDAKGRWASNVRRAVYRFLEKHDDFTYFHSPFTELETAIGFLGRAGSRCPRVDGEERVHLCANGLIQESIISNLATTLVEVYSPKRVVQFCAGDLDMREALLERGVSEVQTVLPDELRDGSNVTDGNALGLRWWQLARGEKYDLCLCLGAAERLGAESANRLIRTCTELSDRVVFAATPPGEFGQAYPNMRPISYWAKEFLANGFVFRDTIRPRLEPLTYVDQAFSDYKVTSTYLLNLHLAERQNAIVGDDGEELVEHLWLGREARVEDLSLQNFYQTLIIDSVRSQLSDARARTWDLDNTRRELEDTNRELDKARMELETIRAVSNLVRRVDSAYQAVQRPGWLGSLFRRALKALTLRAEEKR